MTAIRRTQTKVASRSATTTLPATIHLSKPTARSSRATTLPKTKDLAEPTNPPSSATPTPAAKDLAKSRLRPRGENSSAKAKIEANSTHATPSPELLASIKTLGNLLDDLERVRIMNTNRVAALEREYGSSLPHLDIIAKGMRAVEHEAHLELVRQWRKHPLAPWAKSVQGVGEKSIARLIADIGDPAERPNVAKLWAYCGLGDPARKRRKGMTQEEAFAMGNPHAKKMCWLISEAFVKNRQSPYRAVYDARRAATADRVHASACVRCGPAGKPAAPDSPWSLKHQHEDAKRIAVKAFLKDLWIASRHAVLDSHTISAGGDPK